VGYRLRPLADRTVFAVKRDGRSTREVKIASPSAESSDEAYFCANYRSRNGRARVGFELLQYNAGHGTYGTSGTVRMGKPGATTGMIGCRPRTRRSASGLGFSYQDPAVTELQLAKSQKAERLACQELGLSRRLSSGTLGLSGESNSPTPYRGSLQKGLYFTGIDKYLALFEPLSHPLSIRCQGMRNGAIVRDQEILDAPAWLNTRHPVAGIPPARLDWWDSAPSDS
jgi:hypothetical protein